MSDLERAYIEWRKTRLNETGDAWEAFQAGAALRSPRPSPAAPDMGPLRESFDMLNKVIPFDDALRPHLVKIFRWCHDAAGRPGAVARFEAFLAAPVSPAEGQGI